MRVCLGIPVVGGVPGEVFASHLTLAVAIGRKADIVIPGVFDVMPHDRARMVLANAAIEYKCDLLLFIDSDMEPPRDTFDLLYETMQASKAQVVVGNCYRRGYPFTGVWFKEHQGKVYECYASPESGWHEIDSTGLACALIDVPWMRDHIPEPRFFIGQVNGKVCWEDVWFYKCLRDAGGRLVGDPRVQVGHLGPRMMVNRKTSRFLRNQYEAENPEVLANLKEIAK